ncbi:MerR family DNA-binding transcriptional regulator [Actinoallomurus purpureus]|uniref:MerR family DNA-binding transcriptional regulator n=1 Tax=Actinoallomurus purpureus TaxID=478114 RepID=UPI002093ABF8|nr:MerR family DNA-binding transcriptional regulator [Actinoallomurus purpureus]MCO6005412.1 MerR family DNA-binding transcriptional regulator [Actinoallomurus purpureus]
MTSPRISQLAKRSGVPATTLRFYETAGLPPADRTSAGYRLYGEDAVRLRTGVRHARLERDRRQTGSTTGPNRPE